MIGWNYIYIYWVKTTSHLLSRTVATRAHGHLSAHGRQKKVVVSPKRRIVYVSCSDIYTRICTLYIYVWMICYQKTHDENRLVSWVHMFQTCTTHCHIVFLWANRARDHVFCYQPRGSLGLKNCQQMGRRWSDSTSFDCELIHRI